MEQTYALGLSPLQIEVLLDTVRGFVDNKKLLHIPTVNGEVVGLPLTEEALTWMHDTCGQENEKKDIVVQLRSTADGKTEVVVTCAPNGETFTYEVQLTEFDEQ